MKGKGLRRTMHIIVLLFSINVYAISQTHVFTVSAGLGTIGRSDDVGGSRLYPVKLNWLIEDSHNFNIKHGAYIGYEHWRMKALDGTNISRLLTLNMVDIGVSSDPFNLGIVALKLGGMIGNKYMEGIGIRSGAYFLYGGLKGIVDFFPVYIEYGISRYFEFGGKSYGSPDDPRYNIISIPSFRIEFSIHYAFLEI